MTSSFSIWGCVMEGCFEWCLVLRYGAPFVKRGFEECSRLKPSYGFRIEGLSNFSPSTKTLVQIQDVNPRVYK